MASFTIYVVETLLKKYIRVMNEMKSLPRIPYSTFLVAGQFLFLFRKVLAGTERERHF